MDKHLESEAIEETNPHKQIRDLENEADEAARSAHDFTMMEMPDDELADKFRAEAVRCRYEAYFLAVLHGLDEDAERLEGRLNLRMLA